LTGLSRHVLHKWEQRYAVVSPERTPGGHRVYSEGELSRLRLLRQLTRAGHPIGRIAQLDEDALLALRAQAREIDAPKTPAAASSGTGIALLLAGPSLAALHAEAKGAFASAFPQSHLEVRTDAGPLLAHVGAVSADAAVLELPALSEARLPEIEALRSSGIRTLAVVYRIGSQQAVTRLQDAGVVCLRAPVTAQALIAQLQAFVGRLTDSETDLDALEQAGGVTPNRYSAATLARLTQLSPELRCECPNHLARLLLDISAFEAYSLDCESIDPEERDLHNFLRGVSATARRHFEAALERVLAHEDITLDSLD
jgi:DNA-binding transcriptional MerR regulator